MGELGLNKILGAVLATCLGLFALHELSGIVFGHGGGHHGDDHEEVEMTATERFCNKFAYCVEIADTSGAGPIEEVFDLGLALASADATRGERTFKAQCTTCHTIEAGGANGTGPNLHNIVGAPAAQKAGFNYSAALSGMEKSWTYEELDAWLNNPSSYMRGTSMSFAGLRRDPDRANVIAYLAANTENAPAFPEPIVEDEVVSEEDAEAATEDETATEADTSEEAAPAETDAAPADTAPAPTLEETIEEAANDAGEAVEEAAETVEDAVTSETVEDAPAETENE